MRRDYLQEKNNNNVLGLFLWGERSQPTPPITLCMLFRERASNMAGIPRVCQSSIAFFGFKVMFKSVHVTAVSISSSYLSLQFIF